ncbi:MAG: phosphate ABC transporter permease PstA [Candidatus Geothermincolia bacterium]
MSGITPDLEVARERTPIVADSIVAREARSRAMDRAATIAVWALAMLGLFFLALIVVAILWRGLATALNPHFILGKPASFKEAGGGIWPMIVSSFYLAGLTVVLALPIGIGAAIYMAEYAHEGRLTRMVRFGADSLATVPSIVFGIFGMVLFVVYFGFGYSLIAGALTLTLLNLPTVMRTSEEAIRAVPDTYREASMGLGASRWYTIKKVILPSAVPGITTGAVLTLGRVIGESAAVVYTVGLVSSKVPWSPFQSAAPMAANIWHLYSEGQIIPDWMRIASGEAAFLLLVVLGLTLLARLIAWFFKRKTPVSDRFT